MIREGDILTIQKKHSNSSFTAHSASSESQLRFSKQKHAWSSVLCICLVLIICCGYFTACTSKKESISSVDDLNGNRVGVMTGSIFDQIALDNAPEAKIMYYNALTDLPLAVTNNKIDAFIIDEPLARSMCSTNSGIQMIPELITNDEYAFIFPRNDSDDGVLLNAINAYIEEITADGRIEDLQYKWFDANEDARTIDYDKLDPSNPTLVMGITTDAGAPFAYMKGDEYVGYELDIAYNFCLENGYNLRFENFSGATFINAVVTGKCNFAASCLTITEERKQSVNFSIPDYYGGIVIVVKSDNGDTDTSSFMSQVKNSFRKTFIVERRWILFLEGIASTLIITVISLIAGSILGFLVYQLDRLKSKVISRIIDICIWILHGMPTVVLLMILFYIVFGKANISGFWVATIAFTLTFAASVTSMIRNGVLAVDKGQREAGLALGYNESETFFKIIYPQARRHFISEYKGAIIDLVKATSIVGYIAVQDLTKVSDIVRSRTYDAFFPLFVTALFYFILAIILIGLVKLLYRKTDSKNRSKDKILKGIKEHD